MKFIQYYDKGFWFDGTVFYNGFSTTFKQFQDHDFLWLRPSQEIPFNTGTVYVSVNFVNCIPAIIKKAKNSPNLDIHLGGPVFSHYDSSCNKDISNLHIHAISTVEQHFNLKYDPANWGIELPAVNGNIGYVYSLVTGHGCDWGKCIFCKANNVNKINFKTYGKNEIPIINVPNDKYIWIHTQSATPEQLEPILLNIPDRPDVHIGTYIRGDWKRYDTLYNLLPKAQLPTKNFYFDIGIEVPANDLLKYMKKGSSTESLKATINLLLKWNCRIHINLILGWNNLEQKHVAEVRNFFDGIDVQRIDASLYNLQILEDRPIFKTPPGELEIYSKWKTYLNIPGCYKCKLNTKQNHINNSLYKYYKEAGFKSFDDNYLKNSSL